MRAEPPLQFYLTIDVLLTIDYDCNLTIEDRIYEIDCKKINLQIM